MTEQERLEEQKKRLLQNREKAASGGRDLRPGVLNLDLIGGYRKDLFYKPKVNANTKEGQNKIDILPYIVKTDKHPQQVIIGKDDYILDIWVHHQIGAKQGSYVCLKETYHKPCPICEEREMLSKDPTVPKEQLDKLKPQHKVYYNVIDLDLPGSEQKVQIFDASYSFFEKELAAEACRGEVIIYYNLEQGKSINMRVEESTFNNHKFFKYKRFDFENRKPYTNKIYDYTYSLDELLTITPYEELRAIHVGVDDGAAQPQSDSKALPPRGEGIASLRGEDPAPSGTSASKPIETSALPPRDDTPVDDREGRRRARAAKAEPVKEERCVHGHRFGIDSDLKPECGSQCKTPLWDECMDEFDRLNKGK
jgi:hypothetical protein